jgi:tripartite ATP-independent transporter DctP family solute receptor
MGTRASAFVAGILVGVALTAGVAALAVRIGQLRAPSAQPSVAMTSASDAAPRILRLAHGLNTEHPVHAGLVRFGELLSERSNGRLTVQIFPNGELGSETETLEQLQSDTLDIAKASASPLESFATEYAVLSVPYAFRSGPHLWAVLDGPIGHEILAAAADRNLRGICYYDAGARSFYTTETLVRVPADLQGLKIRVQQSQTAMDMITAFGAAPTPMAYGELYSALQSRLVDGAENNPPSFFSSRHYEVCKYYALNEHARPPDVLVMNERSWQRLTAQEQSWIISAAAESSRYQRELWRTLTDEALAALRGAGVEIVYPDPAPFAEAVAELRASYAGSPVGALLERIAAVADPEPSS